MLKTSRQINTSTKQMYWLKYRTPAGVRTCRGPLILCQYFIFFLNFGRRFKMFPKHFSHFFFLYPLAVYGFVRGFRTWTRLRSHHWCPHPLKITASASLVFIASDLLLPRPSSSAGFHQSSQNLAESSLGFVSLGKHERHFSKETCAFWHFMEGINGNHFFLLVQSWFVYSFLQAK